MPPPAREPVELAGGRAAHHHVGAGAAREIVGAAAAHKPVELAGGPAAHQHVDAGAAREVVGAARAIEDVDAVGAELGRGAGSAGLLEPRGRAFDGESGGARAEGDRAGAGGRVPGKLQRAGRDGRAARIGVRARENQRPSAGLAQRRHAAETVRRRRAARSGLVGDGVRNRVAPAPPKASVPP